MKKRLSKSLIERAEETNDLQLYKVAKGEIDKLSFLIDFVKRNNLGRIFVCGDYLESILRANKARYKKVSSWLANDHDEAYKEIHQKELDLLDEYADTMLAELYENLDDLKARAAADNAQQEEIADRISSK